LPATPGYAQPGFKSINFAVMRIAKLLILFLFYQHNNQINDLAVFPDPSSFKNHASLVGS
jgi:hypothetical protein